MISISSVNRIKNMKELYSCSHLGCAFTGWSFLESNLRKLTKIISKFLGREQFKRKKKTM